MASDTGTGSRMILLTGGAGYIGQVLSSALQERKCSLRHMDALWFRSSLLHDAHTNRLVPADIRDVTPDDFCNVTHVLHLAALSNDVLGAIDAPVTWDINFAATLHLARVAKAAGVRTFIFFSTCSVYGKTPLRNPATEGFPTAPETAYAESKLAAERQLEELGDQRFSVIALRCATAFGASPCPRLDLVVNDFVDSALRSHEIVMLSDGSASRPFVHVQDIAAAAIHFVDNAAGSRFMIVNVGSDAANTTVREVATLVAEIMNVPVRVAAAAQRDTRDYQVSFALLASLMPNHKFVTLEDGVRELISFSLDKQLHLRDRSEFVRIASLRRLIATKQLNDHLRWSRYDSQNE